jgi:hypothetical protein
MRRLAYPGWLPDVVGAERTGAVALAAYLTCHDVSWGSRRCVAQTLFLTCVADAGGPRHP